MVLKNFVQLYLLLCLTTTLQGQNGTYSAFSIAPTHSFSRNFEPFNVPKINYEPSIEIGFTKGKITYFGKFLFSHSLAKDIEKISGNLNDSWYYFSTKTYGIYNTAGVLGIKRNIYTVKLINISIPLGLNILRSVYDESRTIAKFPNQPNYINYPSHDNRQYKKYNLQLNTGIEANLNLLKEAVFLHSQINYYLPPFNNQALWHRVSLNFGLKFQLNQKGA